MSVSNRYRNAWESFWREAPEGPGGVFWDAGPELVAARHLPLFAPHFPRGLPLIDVGCGNGTQTRFLAGHLGRTTGVDLSAAAVGRARRATPDTSGGRLVYEQLDVVDEEATRELHDRLGDANVYLRGVLHQSEPADRGPLLAAVATLVGEHGRAFLTEPSAAAGPLLTGLASAPGGPPPKLRPVLDHGIAPAEVADEAVPELVRQAGLTVLDDGVVDLNTAEYRTDGSRIVLPSLWLVVGRTDAPPS
ncbi:MULTISPECIES: class I SAM-dependent methyltransferase [Streptomyces]|uniref:Class I SAM-dependent methyltransferase n=1 Tax=Streptomyces lycii TaxID=2654337 RepID=A0ABQ7FC59_9ACTN|nr:MULTISPECIES: class I SAM-dependent methyltransferase [Streptomyces]KAF4406437.1 class I SAM-dependent methyltransferase [Streptomyces lycii]PGH47847.1 SAM-dependent methyltransferase [Streptomyces sp. Ru87]